MKKQIWLEFHIMHLFSEKELTEKCFYVFLSAQIYRKNAFIQITVCNIGMVPISYTTIPLNLIS